MNRLYILLILCIPIISAAQISITLKSAIDTTLKNNFDIQIAANNVVISKINNTAGVAGALPSVNANFTDNQSITKVFQRLNSGVEIEKNSTAGNNLTSNLTAGILLFNGFRVVATRARLEHLQKQSELQFNLLIQNSIALVMAKYYDIVRQLEYLKIIQTTLDVSQKKLEIVTDRKNVGMANDADYLQALIDVNLVKQNLKTQQLVVDQTKTELLQFMSIKKYYTYNVEDSIQVDKSLELNTILAYLQKNPQYLSSEQQVKISEQVTKEVSALRYPSLRLNTGFNFNRNQSAAGLTLMNKNYGPYAGIALQVPIYNGNTYKIQKETALYNLDNAKLQQQNLLNSLTADAIKTYQSYSTTLQQLNSQENSVVLSGKLINVVLERFKVNQATILDVKAAQVSYEITGYQLINLKYAAKISEIELKRLLYQLAN
jgi:outer membrane protein TolC